jgi:hypothetical protein
MLGKGKVRPCGVVGVAGALLVSQDLVGLGRAGALAYPCVTSSWGSGSRSGVKSSGVDTGESNDSDGGKGEREWRLATKRSVGDEDNGLKSASNTSRSPNAPLCGRCTRRWKHEGVLESHGHARTGDLGVTFLRVPVNTLFGVVGKVKESTA